MRKITFIFILSLLTFIIIINCNNIKNTAIYSYSDGNANLYIINENSFEYLPVEAVNSSSGNYSGGNYVKNAITEEEFNLLRIYFENAIRNIKDHIANREKMSGLIKKKINDKERSYILTPLSKDKIRLEILLMEIKNK